MVHYFNLDMHLLNVKGEVSREIDVISKLKNVCLLIETKKKMSSFVIKYHLSVIKL